MDSSDPPATTAQFRAGRPHAPGYGIVGTEEGAGLLPWDWAAERLTRARNYFLATTRPDGRPHVMPVWGLWLDDRFLFSTGASSRKARNLAANPYCVVCPEGGEEAVIVEGIAEPVTDPDVLRRFADTYGRKFAWDMSGFSEPVYAVRPHTAFGLIEHADQFASTATRWRFPSG